MKQIMEPVSGYLSPPFHTELHQLCTKNFGEPPMVVRTLTINLWTIIGTIHNNIEFNLEEDLY